jgi:hypothetical protein
VKSLRPRAPAGTLLTNQKVIRQNFRPSSERLTTTTSRAVVPTDVTTSSTGTSSSGGTRVMTYTGGFLTGTSSTLSVFGTTDGCVWDFWRRRDGGPEEDEGREVGEG